MQKINFQNLPSTTTPVNATNLNALQDNIEDVFDGDVPMGNITTGDITVGGTLYTGNNGREDYAEYGFHYDSGGNMIHKRNNSGDSFQMKSYDGTPKVQIMAETGNVNVAGNLGIGGNLENKTMSSTNLNDITTNATYSYDNGNNTYSNAPTTDGIHILNVYNDGSSDWVIQEDYVLRYSSSTVDKYIRLKTPTGWGNWTKIV